MHEDFLFSRDIDDSELDLRNIDDYSATFVALCLKNAVTSLNPEITKNDLDKMKVFEELIPKSYKVSQFGIQI